MTDSQIALPYPTFTNGTTAFGDQVTADFAEVQTKFNAVIDTDGSFKPNFSLKNALLITQAGHTSSDIPVGTVVAKLDQYGNFLLGTHPLLTQTTGNLLGLGIMPTGLMYQQESHYLYLGGGLDIAVIGDPPDHVMSRSGPSNGWAYSTPTGILNGDQLGIIRWRGMTTPPSGTPGVTTGGVFQGDSASIYVKASENNLDNGSGSYSQGGELYLATTANGTFHTVDRLILKNNGDVWFAGGVVRFIGTAGQILADSATSSSNPFLQTRINTDGQSRFVLRQSGALEWGPGSSTPTDTFLARSGVATLSLTGSFALVGGTFSTSGLTGATAASRFVGATTSGAPVSGTFVTGDSIVDQTGLIWVCTAGGTPGTWLSNAAALPAGTLTNAMVNTSAAIALSKLADPGASKVVTSTGSGAIAAFPPGYQIAYAQRTTSVNVTGTTAAAPTDIGLSSGAITYDGTDVWISFFTDRLSRGTGAISIVLYDGSTQLGTIGGATAAAGAAFMRTKITPSAGSHTYKLQAFVDAGTGNVDAGDGTIGNAVPAYIAVTKA